MTQRRWIISTSYAKLERMAKKKPKLKKRKKPSSSAKSFRFGRLKVMPIDMKLVYAAYE